MHDQGRAAPRCCLVGHDRRPPGRQPLLRRVKTSMRLWPILSPSWPRKNAPQGRVIQATANVVIDAGVPATPSKSGKNTHVVPRLSTALVHAYLAITGIH